MLSPFSPRLENGGWLDSNDEAIISIFLMPVSLPHTKQTAFLLF
jgi:hypothetical protein